MLCERASRAAHAGFTCLSSLLAAPAAMLVFSSRSNLRPNPDAASEATRPTLTASRLQSSKESAMKDKKAAKKAISRSAKAGLQVIDPFRCRVPGEGRGDWMGDREQGTGAAQRGA